MRKELPLKDKDKQKRVGIWIRVSTEDQAQGESPEHHERRAKFYAESRGWLVCEVYHLEGVSGKSVVGHAEAKRMMADIKSGHISGLIFSKLARLARNTKELLDFADFFRQENADLISLGESIDTSSPAGRLFYTMISAMAQWEREEISARVQASVSVRAKLGKPLGGAAPFGYRWENQQLVPDDREVPVRKLMYELFLKHRRKKTVARLLNEAGYRTRNGSKFTDTTIDRLLRNPTAKGIRLANYSQSPGDGKSWVFKPEEEWVEIPVEPIISVEVWEEVNAILSAQRTKLKRPSRKTVHLFSGVTFCDCGEKMYVPTKSPKYTCYMCRNKIPTDDLEEIFQIQLKDFFVSSQDILKYLKEADDIIKEKEDLLESLIREQSKLQTEMDKLYRLYMQDEISADGFGRNYRPLEERFEKISEQIPDLQGEVDFLKIQYLSRDEILSESKSLYDRWTDLNHEEKRTIIEQTVERVVIGTGEVNIELGYVPSSYEMVTKRQHNSGVSSS